MRTASFLDTADGARAYHTALTLNAIFDRKRMTPEQWAARCLAVKRERKRREEKTQGAKLRRSRARKRKLKTNPVYRAKKRALHKRRGQRPDVKARHLIYLKARYSTPLAKAVRQAMQAMPEMQIAQRRYNRVRNKKARLARQRAREEDPFLSMVLCTIEEQRYMKRTPPAHTVHANARAKKRRRYKARADKRTLRRATDPVYRDKLRAGERRLAAQPKHKARKAAWARAQRAAARLAKAA